MLKQFMFYFTNLLVNVALKFYIVSSTHAVSNFKMETHSIQVC